MKMYFVFPIENGGFYKLLGFVFFGDFLRRKGSYHGMRFSASRPGPFGSEDFWFTLSKRRRVANPSGESLLSFNSGFCQELLDTIHSEHCIIIAASQKVVEIFFVGFRSQWSG